MNLAAHLLLLWLHAAPWLMGLAAAGILVLLAHELVLRFTPPEQWLAQVRSAWTRLVLGRRTGKWPWLLGGLGLLGLGAHSAVRNEGTVTWALAHPLAILGLHLGLALAGILGFAFWDLEPSHLVRGQGRADAQFRDLPEDFGRFENQDGRRVGSGQSLAALLGYRNPSRKARRALGVLQRRTRNLTLIHLRVDLLTRHILVFGVQGSGKTTTFFGHIMRSATCIWIYQDSKAELPFRTWYPDRLVWGLDVRGHVSRSLVLNFMEEVRSAEDLDLIVDNLFPVNPRDANPWVREMSRTLFGAVLRSRSWGSLQEIARALRATRLEPFLDRLDPIWRDLLKEPKSQVPVLQDLMATLSQWETPRIAAITEGLSTVSLEAFIARGGWVMNNEMSDGLRAPIRLFWAMLMGRLRNRPEGSAPILLLLDEFGDCGRLPNLERALVLLRSKGVSFVAGIQNIGLLKDTYPQNWQAVAQGFGTKAWLMRNADDETRETLTRAIGKFTRKVRASSAKTRPTEREADLMPLDAWGLWSDERAALARSHGFTYWLPLSLAIPAAPLGPLLEPSEAWKEEETPAPMSLGDEASVPLPGSTPVPGLEFLRALEHLSKPASITPAGAPPASPDEEEWP